MLNFITQQRRGTTEEWASSTVIPQAGEFVIEECRNAPIRIKIGDGVHLFKDLKYIDESTVSALTDLESRYNAHVAYVEGGSPVPDSTLATEVLDARYIDGTSYSSLNEAIQSVSDKRVGGMVYDYTGELGIKQPYMLYLTDKDNNIIEETGVRIISGSGGGGGGSSQNVLTITRITPDPFYFTVNDKAVVKFNFSGEDSSGEAITHASATWKVDGKIVGYQEVKEGYNEYTFDNLKVGKSKIFLSIVDDAGGVATKTWEANNIELKVTSTFDDKKKYSVDDYLLFSCYPYGAVDKEIHIILDGEEVKTDSLGANTSGDVYSYEFPKQTHGSHYLQVYTDTWINDKYHSSEPIFKDIIRYDDNSLVPIIGCSYKTIEVKQYETIDLEYYVYDPTTETPTVKIYVDDELVSTRTIDTSVDSYSFQSTDVGDHIVKLVCSNATESTEKLITIAVDSIGVTIEPVLKGLKFDFNPVGKSNSDVTTETAWEQNNIHLSVSANFDWENGGYKFDKDINGDNIVGSYHFCVKAGTTATFDYELFGSEAKTLGKEVKIIFKTCNVVDLSEPFVSCFDDSVKVGLKMHPHDATVSYQGGALSVAYSEEDIIEYEFNITPGSSSVPMVMCYEDGVSTRPSVYAPESHSFTQSNKKFITIGSPYCDVHIYRVKVYERSLESKEVLQNFIADARTPEEMLSRYLRNQIYDKDTKELTPESLANACPWLRVYKLSAPYFTNDKKNKVKNTTIQQILKSGDPVHDNWVAYNCMHSGQGTSSNEYGPAGRNLDFIMNSSGLEDDKFDPKEVHIELGDGTVTDKITLTRTSVPTNYLNAKVNIASSNNITNALLARHYNRNNPYERTFVRDDSENTSYIKDTMEFYNCAIFIQETDPDLQKHREFADTDWHFYAIGNIGDSKKTDKTRSTDPSDEYECCIEIMDVGKPLSGFPEDTMMNAMGVDSTTGEYIWAKDENLDILYEATFDKTSDTAINYNKTYYTNVPVKRLATEEELTTSNLVNLYDRVYHPTEDETVNPDKIYYLNNSGDIATKEDLHDIISPKDAGLYEWRKDYKKTSDKEIIPDKVYYVEIYEMSNAMEYTLQDVRNYTWAKDENLNILYEFDGNEYFKTNDTHVDLNKTYYIREQQRDSEGNVVSTYYYNAMSYTVEQIKIYTYATNENLDNLYEVSYFKTTDETVDLTKTYYVDILENEDFSEDYTYGWRYISDDKNPDVVNYCKQKWIEFYRFLTRSTDEEFKANFENYFVKDSALYYYLFTLRYCMVDNRAKNTFWHYGKTGGTYENDVEIRNANGDILFSATAGEPIRKWDLSWDYDNDTSLGLNNSGVQAYRYGLEDTDYIENSEVFRQSDSTFFNRIRQNFKVELATMYNRLDNSGGGTWNAQSLIAEGDEMQNEFPEELWRLDIERKYIRTYTKSFIDGGPWKAGLTQMCNGRMKYHRRQWERNQEQYISSKFITDAIFNDSTAVSLRGPAQKLSGDAYKAVAPKYEFTLTPRLYTYLNVRYGTTSGEIINKRAEPGKPEIMTYNGEYNDLLYVGNGDAISDLGDLSSFYLEKVSLGNAPKLRGLKLGNNTVGYKNTHFEEWSSGNPLLENLNIENVEWKGSANKTLDLEDMLSLQTIKAFGSNITGVVFAKGSKLNYAELPKTLTTLSLKKLPYLTTDNIKVGSVDKDNNYIKDYTSILDLVVEGCPDVDAIELLNNCTKLNRARLIDVVLDNVTYEYFDTTFINRLLPDGTYGPLKGLTASDEETPNAIITGVAKFKSLTGTQYNELRTRYPNLNIEYELLTCQLQFKLSPEQEPVYTQFVYGTNNKFADCVDPVETGYVTLPTKEQTVSHTYTYSGWSTETDGVTVEPSPLVGVHNDLTLYPTFNEHVRQYTVTFYNNDNNKINSYEVDYGTEEFTYPAEAPKKAGVQDSDCYEFLKWQPEPKNILGDLNCYATYELKPEAIYELTLNDFRYRIEDNSLTLTEYINESKKIVRLRDTYTIDGTNYALKSVGSLSGSDIAFKNKGLEYVVLPNVIETIGSNSFESNNNLTTVNIPESVNNIGKGAFAGCYGLSDVYYDAVNATIHKESSDPSVFDATLSRIGYTVHIGNKVTKIPSYVFTQSSDNEGLSAAKRVLFEEGSNCTIIDQYAFWKCRTEEVSFPESLTDIKSSAFDHGKFKRIVLPSNLKTIESDAFSHCDTLEYVYIPKSVETINSAAFRYSWNFDFDIESGSRFVWINNCLINTATKAMLMGRKDSVIPTNFEIKTISEHCFTEVEIEELEIPEGVTQLNQYALYNCSKLTKLTLPTTLTKIESFGIYGAAYTSIDLRMNLQYMGTYSLVNNPNLIEITFPASLRSIGYQSLENCTALEKVVFKTNQLTITKPDNYTRDLFKGTTKLTRVEVNWRSDDASFTGINNDAPWKAGTNSSGTQQIVPVTVEYTDKTIVYNTDGTTIEVPKEEDA